MNLTSSLFSTAWHGFAVLVSLVAIARVVRSAPWKRLAGNSQRNLLFGFAVALALMWSMKAGVQPGLNLHLLGAMAACLALGAELAIEWSAWPINFVLMAVVPVLIARSLQRLIERFLPAHFFVFIFVIAFVGAALTTVLQGVIASVAMVAAGAYTLEFLRAEYLPYFILLGFAEAWISGAVITLMVVYKPEWVAAFDDRRYLVGK